MIQECTICSNEFIVKKNTTGKYCSLQCWYSDPKKIPEINCPCCKSLFRPKHGNKYCSKPCYDKARRTALRRTNCAFCECALKSTIHPRVRFCSSSCAMKSQSREGQRVKPEGSIQKHGSGYLLVKSNGKWVLQHRYVIEKSIGRKLEKHERVHHKNGNRSDNRLENLELWKVKTKDPAGVRSSDYHCAGCQCS